MARGTSRAQPNSDMKRMLVAVFDNEAKAFDGFRNLQVLDEEDVVAVIASRLIAKDLDGSIRVTNSYDVLPEGTMGGTAVGTLIGLFGGPVGLAIGAAGGFVVGATADFGRTHVVNDFVNEVTAALVPGKSAVVAEIDEEATGPVDARMKSLGGSVFRRPLSDVVDSDYQREVASVEARLARIKARIHESLDHAKAALRRPTRNQSEQGD